MKHFLVLSVLLGIFVTTSDAFASRARRLVLGNGDPVGFLTEGTWFYNEGYNVFYNPAYINEYKNWAIIEKSNSPGTTAQGGFFASIANFNVGAYFNRGNAVDLFTTTTAARMMPLELFVGSDMGVKWGFSFQYASNKQAAAPAATPVVLGGTDTNITLRAGVMIGDLEPFADFKVKGDEQTTVVRSNKNWGLGARYHWGEWTPHAGFRQQTLTVGTTDTKSTLWGFGMGRETKVMDNAKLMYSVGYWRNGGADRNVLPINFAVEGEVTSWLMLRAGLAYNLYDRTAGFNTGDATTGRMGATFKVGKADLDFAVGKAAIVAGGQVGTEGAASGTSLDGQSFDLGNGFFAAASLAYRW